VSHHTQIGSSLSQRAYSNQRESGERLNYQTRAGFSDQPNFRCAVATAFEFRDYLSLFKRLLCGVMKGGPYTVLVVEDEREARLCLTEILEFEGFRAVGCSNGVEALNYLATSAAPSVIVMDMRMPIMNGQELRTELLKDRRLKKIPVIVVTALEPLAAAGLGALRVFRKPVDVSALVSVIRQNC